MGTADPVASGPSAGARRSAPIARISESALARNACLAVSAVPAGSAAIGDLRADAWGHGAATVAAELLAAGAHRLRVDDAETARILRHADVPDVGTDEKPTIDAATVFGLPGTLRADAVPVLSLIGTVLSTKTLRAGEGVSYGFTHRAAADTRVALVTGGYAQGIVRGLGGRVDVSIAGRRHPIVGRVAMDVCVVDVGDAPTGRGDEVVFLGDPVAGEPAIADWLGATGMRAAELVAGVGCRVTRTLAR